MSTHKSTHPDFVVSLQGSLLHVLHYQTKNKRTLHFRTDLRSRYMARHRTYHRCQEVFECVEVLLRTHVSQSHPGR